MSVGVQPIKNKAPKIEKFIINTKVKVFIILVCGSRYKW